MALTIGAFFGIMLAGVPIALATSKPEHTARAVLENHGLSERFTVITGADESVGRSSKASVVAEALLGRDAAAGAAGGGNTHRARASPGRSGRRPRVGGPRRAHGADFVGRRGCADTS